MQHDDDPSQNSLHQSSSACRSIGRPKGDYHKSPGVEKEIVYIVQTDAGQEVLAPYEFAKKYGWKNDPERVRLPRRPTP